MKILVVDDDPSFNDLVSSYLSRQKYEIVSAHSSKTALEELKKDHFDLVLSDYKLPGMDGLELIERIKSTHPGLPVILITNYADIRVAVNSIKLGAFEFVTKPVIPDELLKVIDQALNNSQKTQSTNTKSQQSPDYIIGQNGQHGQLWKHLTMVAPTKMNVLVIGESGTGKEHLARTIHQLSRRSEQPFVAVDCGALSIELAGSELFGHVKGAFTNANSDKKGLFEEANGGTLFLDEVGNLPHEIQILLLRAIQEGTIKRVGGNKEIKVDVRLIAATNEKLDQNVEESNFRLDLYHRLNEFELHASPLRERIDDLEEFCQFFIDQASKELDKEVVPLSAEVQAAFQSYHWPGNLRELKNIIRRAVLLNAEKEIGLDTLPATLLDQPISSTPDQPSSPKKLDIKEQEKQLIKDALEKYKYNKTKAASALNIDRSTLYSKIKLYKIES